MGSEPPVPAPVPRWTDEYAEKRPPSSWTRPVLVDVMEALWSVVVTAAAVGISFALVDGASVDGAWPVVLIVVGVLVVDTAASPLLRRLASLGSLVLAMLLGLLGQLAVFLLAIWLVPGVSIADVLSAVLVVVIAGVVMALGRWLVGATDSGYVVGQALGGARRARRRRARLDAKDAGHAASAEAGRPRGVLVVQLDGVSLPVLRRALAAGQAPHLARWIFGGSHTLSRWWSTIPSTTPASMAGFLHGDDQHVPAFRWWDRAEGRMLAASRPADSSIIETRFEPGQGLLRGGGAAVSTTFSGEADTSLLVISQAIKANRLGSGKFYVSFFSYPLLLAGALVLTVGEMVKELYQGHRQQARDVRPRVPRRGAYILLRGVTNVLLRKLNLSLVATLMNEGRPIIYVDLVDYDEIAHHAGPERPESMRSLEGLDSILGHLRHAAQLVETDYQLVVVSDHGQSLGQTFEQLHGHSLTDQVRSLMADSSVSAVQQTRGEDWGPLNTLVTSVLGRRTSEPDKLVLGPDRHLQESGGQDAESLPDVAVIGSGNLGMAWFPRLAQRPTLDDVNARWPRVVPGLALTEGVGLVMVADADGEPVVFGPRGVHNLATGAVEGQDPLSRYAGRTADDLRRLSGLPDCGDLVLVSTVDELGLVHAFEELVGSHGGVGGSQNDALLVHPADWVLDPQLVRDVDGEQILVGPVAVHHQLLQWRHAFGAGPVDERSSQATR
ncbi:MAG: alkaline phosphatase family protein [Dermatophilaceae bacterium]